MSLQKTFLRRPISLIAGTKKCLGYKTPYEAFEELTGIDIKNLLGYALMT
jgi:hypothetical protein